MNLRPKIAADAVSKIIDDVSKRQILRNIWECLTEPERQDLRQTWEQIILNELQSKSISTSSIVCGLQDVLAAYFVKYPVVKERVDMILKKIKEIDPGARPTIELLSDPEGCHVCCEGQSLSVIPNWSDGFAGVAFEDWYLELEGDAYSDLIHVLG